VKNIQKERLYSLWYGNSSTTRDLEKDDREKPKLPSHQVLLPLAIHNPLGCRCSLWKLGITEISKKQLKFQTGIRYKLHWTELLITASIKASTLSLFHKAPVASVPEGSLGVNLFTRTFTYRLSTEPFNRLVAPKLDWMGKIFWFPTEGSVVVPNSGNLKPEWCL